MTRTGALESRIPPGALPFDACAPCPCFDDVLAGQASFGSGHMGPEVAHIQAAINAVCIAEMMLLTDGLFGTETETAVRAFQLLLGLAAEDGLVGPLTLLALMRLGALDRDEADLDAFGKGGEGPSGPRCAPRFGECAPEGCLSAGDLQRQDQERARGRRARTFDGKIEPSDPGAPDARRSRGPGAPPVRGPSPVRPEPGSTLADAELAGLQGRTMDFARRELDARVHEDRGDNRGTHIDEYVRRARMPLGGEWCGYFTGFNYSEAAREAGGEFTGINGFHSMQKARAFFEYRQYTDNSRSKNAQLDALAEDHAGQGSTRRWMVLSGSGGERHATANHRPHEVYEPASLPIRPGDTALFSRGHVGLVESYDRESGALTTVEGNAGGGRVRRRTYNLNDPTDRARFEGFGRPARGDFSTATPTS